MRTVFSHTLVKFIYNPIIKVVLLESSDDAIEHFFDEIKHFNKEKVEDVLDDIRYMGEYPEKIDW